MNYVGLFEGNKVWEENGCFWREKDNLFIPMNDYLLKWWFDEDIKTIWGDV